MGVILQTYCQIHMLICQSGHPSGTTKIGKFVIANEQDVFLGRFLFQHDPLLWWSKWSYEIRNSTFWDLNRWMVSLTQWPLPNQHRALFCSPFLSEFSFSDARFHANIFRFHPSLRWAVSGLAFFEMCLKWVRIEARGVNSIMDRRYTWMDHSASGGHETLTGHKEKDRLKNAWKNGTLVLSQNKTYLSWLKPRNKPPFWRRF